MRNEAALLPRFLFALTDQRCQPDFLLCIAFDGCDDDSVAIVDAHRSRLPFDIVSVAIDHSAPNAGRARRRALELGMDHLSGDGIVISTDADSVPESNWLNANVAALTAADVAAGRIVREGEPSPVQDRVETYYDALFALRRAIDPVSWEAEITHHYTSGASLAFRASTYAALGGFQPLPSAEDARLVDAAHLAGYRVRRDSDIRVMTSARRYGRAQDGLADHLRWLDDATGDAGATMAHPADVAWRYAGHAVARRAWPDIAAQDRVLAERLHRPLEDVRRIASEAPNSEAFAMRVVPDKPGGERLVALDVAERALAVLHQERSLAA